MLAALGELRDTYQANGHGVELVELGEGWQVLTRPEFTDAIERAQLAARPHRLSGAALETLAIVAYRRPIGRAEIEEIRGVNCGAILKSLQERALIDVTGRGDGMGRPLMYGTTPLFLEQFALRHLEELPACGRAGGHAARGATRDLMSATMRLHRALARAGLASRRRAELLIGEGRVRVNGAIAHIGQGIDPATDMVEVDGRRVNLSVAPPTWIVLHKPAGVMTTRSDPQRRRTVFEFVNDVPGLVYVGRLDLETRGCCS